ncbi:hypothetical protein Scep_005084 [Stephania cephalantha]|uniref:Uncharacterized protein n=1 Tax=Stephania cephalantha TaxID=152367 RepID=A0AAP0KUJ9_9MAGN
MRREKIEKGERRQRERTRERERESEEERDGGTSPGEKTRRAAEAADEGGVTMAPKTVDHHQQQRCNGGMAQPSQTERSRRRPREDSAGKHDTTTGTIAPSTLQEAYERAMDGESFGSTRNGVPVALSTSSHSMRGSGDDQRKTRRSWQRDQPHSVLRFHRMRRIWRQLARDRVRDPVECTDKDSDLVMHRDKDMDMFQLERSRRSPARHGGAQLVAEEPSHTE